MLLWWFVGVFFFTPGSGFFSLPSSLTRLPCCRLHQALSWLSSALCKLFPKSAPPWVLSLRASPSADAAGWHPQDTLQTAGPQGSRRTSTRLMLCQRTTLCNPCKASSSCSLRWAPWGHRHHTSRAAGTRTRRHRADKLFNVILIENTSQLLPHSPPPAQISARVTHGGRPGSGHLGGLEHGTPIRLGDPKKLWAGDASAIPARRELQPKSSSVLSKAHESKCSVPSVHSHCQHHLLRCLPAGGGTPCSTSRRLRGPGRLWGAHEQPKPWVGRGQGE